MRDSWTRRNQRPRIPEAASLRPFGAHRRHHGDAGAALSWYFGGYGIRSFERSMLNFAGIKPTARVFLGSLVPTKRSVHTGIAKLREQGKRAPELTKLFGIRNRYPPM
jgi:hypothetical protein